MAPTLADTIAQAVQQALAQAIEQEKTTLSDIAKAAGQDAGSNIFSDVGSLANVVGAVIDVLAITQPELGVPLELLSKAEHEAGRSGVGFGIGYTLASLFYPAIQPFVLPLQHFTANIAQSEIFDPNTAARLVARGIISQAFGESEAGGGNFDKSHFDQLLEGELVRPDFDTLNRLALLNLVSDQDVDTALQRNGIPQFWWGPLKALRRYLLSPADLALAFLRSDIDKTTLDGYAQQLGITADDMQVLIGNTGEPPGPEQLMEALRRGFIDDARFVRGIEQSRVRNEWVDVERNLAFGPMTTADAVRAVVENYLTSDEGKAIAEMNGLLPEHWQPLLESWGRPLAHEQMLQLYHRGQASLEQVTQAMRESDLKDKYIPLAIALGRRLVPERTIVSMLDHGVIDHQRALTMLKELGFDDQDAESLIMLGTAQRTSSHKGLTRGDILTMYTDTLITRTVALDHLSKLGYSTVDATAMLDLADYKRAAKAIKTAEVGIEASLKAHHLTPDQAVSALLKAGLDATQARTLVDEWLQQRATVTRTLTESQVIKAVADKIISQDNGRIRLKAQGLADDDVTILYQLHGILPVV